MQDLHTIVAGYVGELAGAQADDASYSLLELGPVALPHLAEAFRLAGDYRVRLRLAEVVCHLRSIDALPFLRELLDNRDPTMWKTALDGLVMIGDDLTGQTHVLEVLAAAREVADAEKRSWIDEAVGQIPPATRPA
jgi:hypothetical protein